MKEELPIRVLRSHLGDAAYLELLNKIDRK